MCAALELRVQETHEGATDCYCTNPCVWGSRHTAAPCIGFLINSHAQDHRAKEYLADFSLGEGLKVEGVTLEIWFGMLGSRFGV